MNIRIYVNFILGIPAILARPVDKTFDPRFCSVPLPPPQNCAPYGAEVAER